eukprot:400565_1
MIRITWCPPYLSLTQIMTLGLLINLFKCDSINNKCHINENNILIYNTTPNIEINTAQIIHHQTLNYDTSIEINSFYQCTNMELCNSLINITNIKNTNITNNNNNSIKSY